MLTKNSQKQLYSPKTRQQIMSNKLLNSDLLELYIVERIVISVSDFKRIRKDCTVTYKGITYILSYLEFLPKFLDTNRVTHLNLSFRTPRYVGKDEILEVTKKYSYCLVSLIKWLGVY